MLILGVDPGPETSGYALLDTAVWAFIGHDKAISNGQLRGLVTSEDGTAYFNGNELHAVAIERPVMMGQAQASADLYNTLWEGGRFYQAFIRHLPDVEAIGRNKIKTHLLGRSNLPKSDALIVEVLKERFAPGAGTKDAPGPLYGLSSHAWQAAAVALVFFDLYADEVLR